MTNPTPIPEPPRPDVYPGGPLPDYCVGGEVVGAGGGGTAVLLDSKTGQPASQVMETTVRLFQHGDGRWYYLFDGVPQGSYQVEVQLDSGATISAAGLSPGTAGSVSI
jgi:hypothetical protein